MLTIHLFGPPRFLRNRSPIHLSRRKGVALVSYLAQADLPVGREAVATLLWPEHEQSAALKALRRDLSRVKKELGHESITVTQSQLALCDPACAAVDVSHFRQLVQLVREHGHFPKAQCSTCLDALNNAVKLQKDDFMAGFNLPDCPEFDDWQNFQRESLRQELSQSLGKLANWHTSQRQYARAIDHGRRWLALDPLNEKACRALMRAYVEAGQSAQALRVYENVAQLLHDQLGIVPADESQELCRAIRSRRNGDAGETTAARTNGQSQVTRSLRIGRRSNLPQQPTTFIGRSHELTMIRLRLEDPGCRLLTLVGPGGIGKTRLALEAGRRMLESRVPQFADGIFFVPLGTVREVSGILPAIVAAAEFSLYGNRPQEQQFLDHLRDKQMLFILDNLEHLSASAEIIEAILTAAPGVKILATSRAALRLQEEWFHPLGGLSVPPAVSAAWISRTTAEGLASLRTYDAVQLFEERAHHASPSFRLSDEVEHVVRICRLVEGMPLALELAATWLKVLNAREMADELEQSLDLLVSRLQNVPLRHRSLRAVLNQTWEMLDAAEQNALARLSVFCGGFSREAALQVADADLFLLSALVDKALLYMTTRGRYRLHELMRQFAAEQLAGIGLDEETSATHAHYFMRSLAQQTGQLKGARQLEARHQIKDALEDIRLAWKWALRNQEWEVIAQSLESIFLYFYTRGRNQEGVKFLRPICDCLAPSDNETPHAVWGRILSRVCLMKSFLSTETALESEIQASLAIARDAQDEDEMAFCHFVQGVFHTLVREDASAAVEELQWAHQAYRAMNDSFYLVQVLIWLGFCHGNNGRLDRYFALNREALDLAREAGHHACAANALGNLVGGAFCVGDYATAERYAHEVGAIGAAMELPSMITHSKMQLCLANFLKGNIELSGDLAEEAHELALEINHPLSIAYTLTFRSLIASVNGDYETGRHFSERSLAMPASRFGVIMAHWAIAIACCGLGHDDAAQRHAMSMLQLARPAGFVGMATWPFPVLAIVRANAGQQENAVELLSLACSHPLSPSGWQEKWPLLAELRCHLEQELGAETFAAAWQRGAALDLDAAIATAFDGRPVLTYGEAESLIGR